MAASAACATFWVGGLQLHSGRRSLEAVSRRMSSPAASSHRSRTTSDVVAAPRAMNRIRDARRARRRTRRETRPRFIESTAESSACRLDLASRAPTSLEPSRCPTTMRRHESEQSEKGADLFRTVPWLPASGYDPGPSVRGPSISRGAATTSDVVRGPDEEAAGEDIRRETASSDRRPLCS